MDFSLWDNGFMTSDPEQLTRRYFALSNQANFAAIERLLDPGATYSSAHTGLYYGVGDIMAMMREFFAAYDALTWHIDACLLYTSPSPRDRTRSRMPSSA